MGKIHPGGISVQKTGITLTGGHPVKFSGAGKMSGKIHPGGIVPQAPGVTMNSRAGTFVKQAKPSTHGHNKLLSSGSKAEFLPRGTGVHPGESSGVRSPKRSYEK